MAEQALVAAREWGAEFGRRAATADGIDGLRALTREMMEQRSAGAIDPLVGFEAIKVGGVGAEVGELSDGSRGPLYMHVHGGGFIISSPPDDRYFLAKVVRAAGGRSLSVDYRLAPEAPYPAAVEDCLAAYRWAVAEAGAENVVLGGESSGGGLAVLTAVAAREAGLPMPAGLVLLSPFVDYALTAASLDGNAATDAFLNRAGLQASVGAFLQGADPEACSPLFADLGGLPPALIQVGGEEVLLDDARRLAEALRDAGCEAELELWDGVVHLWHGFPRLPAAALATARITEFVDERTGSRDVSD